MNDAAVMRWRQKNLPDLQDRHALITGGASGLGFETAVGLVQQNASVILADRNVQGGQAAAERIRAIKPDANVEFRALDLARLDDIRAFSSALNNDHPQLDILINNAGILPPLRRQTTHDGFELKFGINVLGHFALVGHLLPALLRAPAPRVVTISSLVHRNAKIDFDDLQGERHYLAQRAYNQAKLACLIFAMELQERSVRNGWNLASLAAHPGIARTSLGTTRKLERRRNLTDYLEAFGFWVAMNFLSQEQSLGALPILYAAASAQAHGGEFFGPDGFGEFRGLPKRVEPSAPAQDPAIRQRLWDCCEQLTGVRYPQT